MADADEASVVVVVGAAADAAVMALALGFDDLAGAEEELVRFGDPHDVGARDHKARAVRAATVRGDEAVAGVLTGGGHHGRGQSSQKYKETAQHGFPL